MSESYLDFTHLIKHIPRDKPNIGDEPNIEDEPNIGDGQIYQKPNIKHHVPNLTYTENP